MESFNLHTAGQEDLPLITGLAKRVWNHTYKDIHTQEQLDYMFEQMYSEESLLKQMNDGHRFYIAFSGEEPIGYMSVQQKEKDLFILQKLYVVPEYQGTGAGKFMFRSAITETKKIHPSPCVLELNVNRRNKAIKFYERMGMEKFRQCDEPIGNGFMMNCQYMRMKI